MKRGVAMLDSPSVDDSSRLDTQQSSKTTNQETSDLDPNEKTPNDQRPPTRIDPRAIDGELRVLERLYVAACRELNDWEALARYANTTASDARTLADAAWHVAEWATVSELVPQIEASGVCDHQSSDQTEHLQVCVLTPSTQLFFAP